MNRNPMSATNDPEVRRLAPGQCDEGRVEQVLLAHPSVADCAVLERTTDQDQVELLAYIVPASAFAVEELRDRIAPTSLPRPAQFIPVSSITLMPDGRVDAACLTRLQVTDAALLERWETGAKSVKSIDRAAVLVDGA